MDREEKMNKYWLVLCERSREEKREKQREIDAEIAQLKNSFDKLLAEPEEKKTWCCFRKRKK